MEILTAHIILLTNGVYLLNSNDNQQTQREINIREKLASLCVPETFELEGQSVCQEGMGM